MRYRIDWGLHAVLKLAAQSGPLSILDVGSGAGEHASLLKAAGHNVWTVDFDKEADYSGDFMEIGFCREFDAIFCSHVLEHQRNIGAFLEKLYSLLRDDGILSIVVPIHPPERLIAGHVSAWSFYLLVYNLVLAGFDCHKAQVLSTYELSLFVKKTPAHIDSAYKNSVIGDPGADYFSSIRQYFPIQIDQGDTVKNGFSVGWEFNLPKLKGSDIVCKHLGEVIDLS